MTADPLLWLLQLRAKNRGLQVTVVSPDELQVVGASSGTSWTVRLESLRRQAEEESRDQWGGLIDHFLGSLQEADDSREDRDDLESLRPHLRTRLYPVDRELPEGMVPVSRLIAPGLVECLVADRPASVVTLSRETVADWPLGDQELLDLGRANVASADRLSVETDVIDGAQVATLTGDADYASAHLCWLDEYPVVGPYGALVAVPEEGVLFAHPLTDGSVLAAGGVLAGAVVRVHDEAHRPIGRHLYHWRDGGIELAAELETADGELSIVVTERFQELMEHLSGGPVTNA